MKVSFVNHASVSFEHEGVKLVTDPWLFGDAFNEGWQLMCETRMTTQQLAEVDYIWFSHEHPDHFSPRVLMSIPERARARITILYQKTRDQKVLSFCRAKGFATRELPDGIRTSIGPGFWVTVRPVPIYDSWLLVEAGGRRVLNLNDAPVHGRGALKKLAAQVGRLDVLLTQFGYAGWRGNEEDVGLRRRDARKKLDMVERQVRHLSPRHTIPFASFAFYAHQENGFMNDALGRVDEAAKAIERAGSVPVVMFPGDEWTIGEPADTAAAIERYEAVYASLPERALTPASSCTWQELVEAAHAYRDRIRAANDAFTLGLLRRNPVLPALRPIDIHLWDLRADVRFSFERGLERVVGRSPAYDLQMSSDSLRFIFAHRWGTDTLAVNARFRADAGGVKRLLTTFGVDQLNNIGIRVSPRFLVDFPSHAFLLRALGRKLWSLREQRAAVH